MESNVIEMGTEAKQLHNVSVRKVDHTKGEFRSEVSSQWFSRPDDEKFLDLNSLYAYTKQVADASRMGLLDVDSIQVHAKDDGEGLTLSSPQIEDAEVIPNNWSFGQLCSLVGAPGSYLRKLPSQIAGINMQYGISNYRQGTVQAYVSGIADEGVELRAATGVDYGRIYDHEVVEAVMKLAGNGTGDTNWKVPGMMNWRDGSYDPNSPITRESTTLFASDRDVFLFLVDDRNPIQIGFLPDGSPDLLFRGFYVWNSEVGNKSLGVACFYLRGVCQNRCLWGVEGFKQITMRHSKYAPQRFMSEIRPALNSFANSSTAALIQGVETAKGTRVANNDDEAQEFLSKQRFNKSQINDIINSVVEEEDRKPRSVWDFVQGITAVAREKGNQDARLDMERIAGRLLDKVA